MDSAVDPDPPDSLGTENDFDFDSLWNWAPGLDHHAAAPPVTGPPHIHHMPGPPGGQRSFDAFHPHAAFGGVGPHPMAHGSNGNGHVATTAGMNLNVSLYPASDFG